MARPNHLKSFLLCAIVPITFILISSRYTLQQRNELTMDSPELLEKDDNGENGMDAFESMEQSSAGPMVGEKDELLIEWPQGWHRLLLRKFGRRALPIDGVKAKAMPCCAESIGQHVCNELRNRNPLLFRKRCKADADFAILQCCHSCRTNVAELGRELFAAGLKSRHCFDRHNRHFCAHFVHQSGMWAANVGKSVNCNGDGAALAFRVCRRSCGFCDVKLYQQQNRNCISRLWKIATTNGTTPTTATITLNGERWKPKVIMTTTQPQPLKSSSSPKPTTTATTSSSTATRIASPASSPPTLLPTHLTPTTPRLRPCTLPSLPPLPSIPLPSMPWLPSPCLPLEPIAPLKWLTPATIATSTHSATRPRPTANPLPPLPVPLPPIVPIGRPPKGSSSRRRSGTTITIAWKPSPSAELPIPLPDEIIEAILNKLSGIDVDNYAVGECRECDEKSAESVEGPESAEKSERAKNSHEKSGEAGPAVAAAAAVQAEEVALLLDVLLKAAATHLMETEEETAADVADE
uniref:Uncharacterized protein n=1 Tax=Globodera rostochiensis TaxID=31243 RepID=A0A914I465_GLORO